MSLDGKPAVDQSDGYHTVRKSYDERGNCVEVEYYGADGQRCLIKDGYAKFMSDYDDRGNEVKVACFGLRDEPAIDQSIGYQTAKMSYDEHGNHIAWEYYGADGQRCLTRDGYAKVTADYDERGNQLKWACFDLNGKPTINQSDGYHTVKKS
jgi:eukaryotic-like serine/threonine-protein kinase